MRCACSAHAEQDFTGDASESDLCKAFAKARELEIFVYDELLKMLNGEFLFLFLHTGN